MTSRFHKSDRPASRAVAIFGAALIFVSQLIGVGHFHESALSRNGVITATLSVDPGLCPICELALHSPGSFAAAATVAHGPDIAGTIFLAAPSRAASPVFLTARVRAPPIL
jgi:hypothetical protein